MSQFVPLWKTNLAGCRNLSIDVLKYTIAVANTVWMMFILAPPVAMFILKWPTNPQVGHYRIASDFNGAELILAVSVLFFFSVTQPKRTHVVNIYSLLGELEGKTHGYDVYTELAMLARAFSLAFPLLLIPLNSIYSLLYAVGQYSYQVGAIVLMHKENYKKLAPYFQEQGKQPDSTAT